MSQAKVDRYKEEKKNRKKIMAREKRERILTQAALAVAGIAIVAWLGVSAYQTLRTPTEETAAEAVSYTIDSTALDDYLAALEDA